MEISDYPVHPVAALFPLLSDEEMAELAENITAQGLLQPIVLDSEGRILDGRNRLRACALAGVAPRFETYTGEDPAGYALSVNTARRHLTKGQVAMVAAQARMLESNNRISQEEAARRAGVSRPYIAQAEIIIQYAPALVEPVRAGGSLSDAYLKAQKIASAEADLSRLKNSLNLQLEQIGAPVAIRPAPNLSPNGMVSMPVVLAGANEEAELLRQQRMLLHNLNKVSQLLRAARDTLPPLGGPMAGLMAPGVLARISRIVDDAYAIAEVCQADYAAARTVRILPHAGEPAAGTGEEPAS